MFAILNVISQLVKVNYYIVPGVSLLLHLAKYFIVYIHKVLRGVYLIEMQWYFDKYHGTYLKQ